MTNILEGARAEIVVVGSGPGGAVTACLLAEAGRDVLLVEEGADFKQSSCEQFSSQEMVQKYRNGGVTVALGRTNVVYVEGRCSGGGSEINSGLCTRVSAEILEEWSRTYAVQELSETDLRPYFETNERELHTSLSPKTAPASQKLHDGANILGWQSRDVPRWVRFGDSVDGTPSTVIRESMTETFIPRAQAAGCRTLSNARAIRLRRHRDAWEVLLERRSEGSPPERTRIRVKYVILACGAIQTPALLLRSGIRKNIGNSLRLHPMLKVIAQFPDEVVPFDTSMPAGQITEFSPQITIGCSISKPAFLATLMLSDADNLGEVEKSWRQMAAYYAMTRGGSGTVRILPGFQDPLVRYHLDDDDLSELSQGLIRLCEALFAAGATTVYPSVSGLGPLHSNDDLSRIPVVLPAGDTNLTTVHLMGTCPMGENQAICATDSYGQVWGQEGLFVADASLLGSAIGTNPQATIMAIARRNTERFLARH